MTEPTSISLSSRAVVQVTGPDWRPFLQGLLTNDVETVVEGEARFAGLLTPQGRLLYDLFVIPDADGCWLDVEAGWRDGLIQRLMMYRLRAKVDISASALPVSAHLGESRPTGQARAVRDPRLSALGWRVYGAAGRLDESHYNAHRLALGVPGAADWGTDKTYPIEANFDRLGGIDFKKGCFVGQETTSRMHRRGKVATRMLPVDFEGAAPVYGAEILNGSLRAGDILSGMDGRAMAALRLDRMEGELTVEGRVVRPDPPAWIQGADS